MFSGSQHTPEELAAARTAVRNDAGAAALSLAGTATALGVLKIGERMMAAGEGGEHGAVAGAHAVAERTQAGYDHGVVANGTVDVAQTAPQTVSPVAVGGDGGQPTDQASIAAERARHSGHSGHTQPPARQP